MARKPGMHRPGTTPQLGTRATFHIPGSGQTRAAKKDIEWDVGGRTQEGQKGTRCGRSV